MQTVQRSLAGRYRLERVIGRGGMSTVYRATDEVLGRSVAVKMLLGSLAEQDPTYAARFEREARAAAALASSSVVTVYDTGIDEEGAHYIVMEYVAGHSLAELLADGPPLAVAEAVRVAERVSHALRAAHAAGILHRDIKPANVMIAADASVKVLDFGIARRLDGTTLTQSASIVGTAAYIAPERALGQPGDVRADIYSLGCLLYAMLTGRPPFTGELAAAVLHQQVTAQPAAPSRLRAGIPMALDALVLQMLAKPPEARPASAEAVRQRLLALPSVGAVGGTPAVAAARATDRTATMHPTASTVLARRARPAGILATSMADHRWRAVVMAVATALVALLALALLAGGTTHQTARASNTRQSMRTHGGGQATVPAGLTRPPAAPAKPGQGPSGGPGAGGGPPGHRGHHGGDGGHGGGPPGPGGGDGGD